MYEIIPPPPEIYPPNIRELCIVYISFIAKNQTMNELVAVKVEIESYIAVGRNHA